MEREKRGISWIEEVRTIILATPLSEFEVHTSLVPIRRMHGGRRKGGETVAKSSSFFMMEGTLNAKK